MNILVGCEYSGTVRDAFRRKGHNAISCDLLPTEVPGPHYECNVLELIRCSWDLVILHPPCTHLAVSGARWWKDKLHQQVDALVMFRILLEQTNSPKVCIENPIGKVSSAIKQPSQIIQPWMFGHGETKATCLWLKGLPNLRPTNIVPGREARIHRQPPSEDRWKIRSLTYQGVADAMADQWG